MVKTVHGNNDFSSPHKAYTLDQIPTPVLKFLVIFGPILHRLAKLSQIIQWQSSNSREPIILILVWNIICLWTWPILSLLPCLFIYDFASQWFQIRIIESHIERQEKKRQPIEVKHGYSEDDEDDERAQLLLKQQQQEYEKESLIPRKIQLSNQISLDDTLRDLAILNQWMDHACKPLVSKNVSSRISNLSWLLYGWPFWFLACWVLGAHAILALLGTVFILSRSPRWQIVVMALKRNKFIHSLLISLWSYGVAFLTSTLSSLKKRTTFKSWLKSIWINAGSEKSKILTELKVKKIESTGVDNKSNDMIFQFEIYENQRWWLGAGWTTNMMPNEREAWTDKQARPMSSKDDFKLPQTTIRSIRNENQDVIHIEKSWVWVDDDWWVDMTDEITDRIDAYGWEYGNNAWQQFKNTPYIQSFTRRRTWCRRAKLTEYELSNKKNV